MGEDVGYEDGALVGGAEVVRRGQGLAQAFFGQFVVAAIVEPDSVEVFCVLEVAHGVEGHVDGAVAVVVARLHLGGEYADDGEEDAVEADGLAQRIAAAEELRFGFRPDDANVGSLLVFGAVEEAALIQVQLPDVLKLGADSDNAPRVSMQIVLHGDLLIDFRRDEEDAGHAVGDAVHVVQGEADLGAGLVSAGLLAGAAGKDADHVGAPLGKDILDGAAESSAVGQQNYDGGDAPGHADHGDGGAAAVVEHRFPGLGENVFQHVATLLAGVRGQGSEISFIPVERTVTAP